MKAEIKEKKPRKQRRNFYNEKTIVVSFKCPESKVCEFRSHCLKPLKKWQINFKK